MYQNVALRRDCCMMSACSRLTAQGIGDCSVPVIGWCTRLHSYSCVQTIFSQYKLLCPVAQLTASLKTNQGKMDSEEIYIAALKEKACELVETAMRNAQESLRSLQRVQGEESVNEQEHKVKNIQWLSCEDFNVELGKKQIEEYVLTWEFHESWLYCTDFLREEDTEFNKLFHYRMRWSIPTCRKPIPRATACVYFTIKISKIKPPTLPVEVFFVFESNRLVHRPGETRFREKWLKDIIESKLIMMNSITF